MGEEFASRKTVYVVREVLKEKEFLRTCKCSCRSSGLAVVLRIWLKDSKGYVRQEEIRKNFTNLAELEGGFFLQMIEWFETERALCAVFPWFEGYSLGSYLKTVRAIPEEKARLTFSKLCDFVDCIHSKGIAHRNLNPDNILMNDAGELKVVGWTNQLKPSTVQEICEKTELSPFDPPEVLARQQAVGTYHDYWSLGVLLFTMVNGMPPWRGETQGEILGAMRSGNVLKPNAMSITCHNLCLKFCDMEPSRRFSPLMARSHSWMNGDAEGKRTPLARVARGSAKTGTPVSLPRVVTKMG
jgi:MAP/microtubule affinity-regulating kinase